MCGRFVSSASAWELADYLDVDESDVSYLGSDGSDPAGTIGEEAGTEGEEPGDLDAFAAPPSWNVAPTDDVWAVNARRNDAGELRRRLRRYRWGLVPSWSKSPAVGVRSFNARAETVMEKPMFRNALERRRCIVPADAFYEWEHDQSGGRSGRRKRALPWCFRPAKGEYLAFAGLWEFWREGPRQGLDLAVPGSDRSDRPYLVTCTIITTDANAVVAPVHDRMPVVLPPEAWGDWLSEGPLPGDLLDDLLLPPPDDALIAYRVAPLVNDVRLNGPELVEPDAGDEAGIADRTEGVGSAAGPTAASQLFDPADLA
jgi:putative SOS response-associated peptidase YedK